MDRRRISRKIKFELNEILREEGIEYGRTWSDGIFDHTTCINTEGVAKLLSEQRVDGPQNSSPSRVNYRRNHSEFDISLWSKFQCEKGSILLGII